MKTSALLLSTAIGVTVAMAMGTAGFAAAHHTTSAVNHMQPSKVPGSTTKVKSSVVGSGYYGATSTTSFTTLDTESVNCRTRTTCTFLMSAMVQQCSFTGTYPANDYAIVVSVDGNYVDGGPFAGGTNTSHPCDIDNWQGVYGGLAAGAHSVVFQTYESSTAYLAQWSDRTDVGSP